MALTPTSIQCGYLIDIRESGTLFARPQLAFLPSYGQIAAKSVGKHQFTTFAVYTNSRAKRRI
ncbi:Uncharacterised protein [Mycobacteroides abscessus subsp. massiliense]|nr:Uncharacterised protein [Mycobacteroides abscessus subsp. massiliense]SKZ40483.1 Uncharacterised protein [Mycobacteroides abscessus subsp. massiliense]